MESVLLGFLARCWTAGQDRRPAADPFRAVRSLAVVRLNRAFPCCRSLTLSRAHVSACIRLSSCPPIRFLVPSPWQACHRRGGHREGTWYHPRARTTRRVERPVTGPEHYRRAGELAAEAHRLLGRGDGQATADVWARRGPDPCGAYPCGRRGRRIRCGSPRLGRRRRAFRSVARIGVKVPAAPGGRFHGGAEVKLRAPMSCG
jgi:hypothetical protein